MGERNATLGLRCRRCGAPIECCEFCEGEDCAKAVCYDCLTIELGEEVPEPYAHG